MTSKQCFEKGCKRATLYVCSYLPLEICSCEKHLEKYFNRNNTKQSINVEIQNLSVSSENIPVFDDIHSEINKNQLNLQDQGTKNLDILKKENDWEALWLLFESQYSALIQSLSPYSHSPLNYCLITSLFRTREDFNRTKLIMYDTQCERREEIIVDTPELLNSGTSITQLPNGWLFCYGKQDPTSGITIIIDDAYRVKILPSGIPCYCSSSIYFNGNIYCFGRKDDNGQFLYLSSKFDLNKNRWINLASMPKIDCLCDSEIFNESILISGLFNKNLVLYSADIDSFSTIPYDFAGFKRKILINADKLYLIECDGLIYESEDEYNWQLISTSVINSYNPTQVYCSYNKGGIYITESRTDNIYRFDLSQKLMTVIRKERKY